MNKTYLVVVNNLLLLSLFIPQLNFQQVCIIFTVLVLNFAFLYLDKLKLVKKEDNENTEIKEYKEKIELERLKNEYTKVLIQQGNIQTSMNQMKKSPQNKDFIGKVKF